jgi:hypothetical protein
MLLGEARASSTIRCGGVAGRAAASTDQRLVPGQAILNHTGARESEHTFHQPVSGRTSPR